MATGTPDVDDIQVNERRRLSKRKGEKKNLTSHCQKSVGAQDFGVIENDNWRMFGLLGFRAALIKKTIQHDPMPVKHFDILAWMVFLFKFRFTGREGTDEEENDVIHEEDDGRWLTTKTRK